MTYFYRQGLMARFLKYWIEADHPRAPGGQPIGGRFIPSKWTPHHEPGINPVEYHPAPNRNRKITPLMRQRWMHAQMHQHGGKVSLWTEMEPWLKENPEP